MDAFQARLQEALPERYVLKHEIGRGGMAVVFLAWDHRFECDVALKVLRPELSATLGPSRFLQEIKTAARLKHPYILKLHDSGEAGGLLYYVMPWLEGDTLRQRLIQNGPLPLNDALRIAREVAEALDYAHKNGVVHRDIKPENILFEAGHAVVSDFGIALAVSEAAPRSTGSGTVLGTLEYMSPEQAAGKVELDGRTDIYSLGIVLYEMLIGTVPGVDFEGITKTFERKRPDVSASVIDILRRALAPNRFNRYETGQQFADALSKTGAGGTNWRRVAAAAVLIAGRAMMLWGLGANAPRRVDPERYVIIPFAHTRGAAPQLIDGDLCARLLYQGFAQWADVKVTEPLRVADLIHRAKYDSRSLSLDDGLEIARRVGAGKLVRAELWEFRDTTYVTAGVYDLTDHDRQIVTRSTRIAPGMSEGVVFYALADSLLYAGARAPPGAPMGRATTSTRALLAHEEAHKALDQWDLDRAADGFRRAVSYDSGFAHALLELAQVKAWQELDVETWRDTATRAARMADRLVPRERYLARALDAIGAGRHDDACAQYRALLARDSLDATAWYGLGECHAKDRVVFRDPRSPSGWSFRGSVHQAALAYRRALDLAPSLNLVFRGQVYAHLAALLYTESHRLRSGRPLPPDTGLFVAYPDFIADTLAFIPHRAMRVFSGAEGAPRNAADAMVHTRQLLGQIVTSWVRAFPSSAEAHDAQAQWLEAHGRLTSPRPGDTTALSEIRAARRQAPDSDQVALAVSEIRVLLKSQDFRAARSVADSLLNTARAADARSAGAFASIAVLTGRVALAAELLRRAAAESDPWTLEGPRLGAPLPVLQGVGSFTAFAATGMPAESVSVALRHADSLIRVWVPKGRQALARRALLVPAVMLSFPTVGVSPAHEPNSNNYLIEMQLQLARGDSSAVREQLAQWHANRRTLVYGEVSVDGIYSEAQLFLALGDSAGARDHLDGWLRSLAISRRSLVWQPTQAGALVRVMALRAELADRAGDRRTAARWAANVLALWSNADSGLQPLVERMRRIG